MSVEIVVIGAVTISAWVIGYVCGAPLHPDHSCEEMVRWRHYGGRERGEPKPK